MMDQNWTALRWVQLQGPRLLSLDSDGKLQRGPAMWTLNAGAPYFNGQNLADYAHPLRTLMVDTQETQIVPESGQFLDKGPPGPRTLRSPRLIDLHVILGSVLWKAGLERLTVRFRAEDNVKGSTRNDPDKPAFQTPKVGDNTDPVAAFARVLAEPLPDYPKGQRGDFVDQAGVKPDLQDAIRVPPLRLVQGAIPLTILTGKLAWLGDLDQGAVTTKGGLLLTPDGIELTTSLHFPGTNGRLKGRFLIAPRVPGVRADQTASMDGPRASWLTMTLLPNHPDTMAEPGWQEAWQNVSQLSAVDRCGIDIRARQGSPLPAFRWPLSFKPSAVDATEFAIADPPAVVDVPTGDMRIELRGSKGPDGTPEGAAVLQLNRLRIADRAAITDVALSLKQGGLLPDAIVPDGDTVIIAEAVAPEDATPASGMAPPKATTARYWTKTTITKGDSATLELQLMRSGAGASVALPVNYDEHGLAAALRNVYGWNEPLPLKALVSGSGDVTTGSDPLDPEAIHPIVPAFLPLERGWLQLPLPNLAPLDVTKDATLIGAIGATARSALDGFFRIAGYAGASGLISGYPIDGAVAVASPIGDTAPWSVTVDGASAAIVLAGVTNSDLVQTFAVLREPQLSTRGLLWLSTDCPDAIEALPRLSAGPGSFVDVEFTTTPVPDPANRVVTATFNSLIADFGNSKPTSRRSLGIDLAFNVGADEWVTGLATTAKGRQTLSDALAALTNVPQPSAANLDALRNDALQCQQRLNSADADLSEAQIRSGLLAKQLGAAQSEMGVAKAQLAALKTAIANTQAELVAAQQQNDQERANQASLYLNLLQAKSTRLPARIDQLTNQVTTLQSQKPNADGQTNALASAAAFARAAFTAAHQLLVEAQTGSMAESPRPWPAVAWLRHSFLPLAAAMPMTRTAASAIPALESRELAPFVADTLTDGKSIKLASLTWAGAQVFPDLATTLQYRSLAYGWPVPTAAALQPLDDGVPRVGFGIPFVEFGVPGVELVPVRTVGADGAEPSQWNALRFAARFDIPALDEAFATAGLPEVQQPLPQQDDRSAPPPAATATALDWASLRQFWQQQDRRRQLAMVTDSYLDTFYSANGPQTWAVQTLIRKSVWSTKAEFVADQSAGGLPYGALKLSELSHPLQGNDALRGVSGSITIGDGTIAVDPNGVADSALGDKIGLLGWSPSTFDKGDLRIDNQGFGVADPTLSNEVLTRRFQTTIAGPLGLFVSASREMAIDGTATLAFWFKDVPLDSTGSYAAPTDLGVDFSAWMHPQEGLEWRLYRADRLDAFKGGHDRLPFYGFAIEPLRLKQLKFTLDGNGRPAKRIPDRIVVRARILLADDVSRPPLGGNLVDLTLTANGDGLRIASVDAADAAPLQFAFVTSGSSGQSRQVLLTGRPAWNGTSFGLANSSLLLPLHGQQLLLPDATVSNPSFENLSITWPGAALPEIAPLQPGAGQLRITNVTIECTVKADGSFGIARELTFDSLLEINATSPNGDAGGGGSAIRLERTATTTGFSLLGANISLDAGDVVESDRAIVVTKNLKLTTDWSPFPWMKLSMPDVALMLAATIEAPRDSRPGVLPLGCGRCEGEARQADSPFPLHVRVLRFTAESQISSLITEPNGLSPAWRGSMSVSGVLTSDSSIQWPRLKTSGTNGHRTVSRDAGGAILHSATYIYDDHQLPFGHCGVSGNTGMLSKPWTVFAAVQHSLRDSGSTTAPAISWSGVETISIGAAEQLIPTLSTSDAVTFAARYRAPYVVPKPAKPLPPDSTMIQPGIGALRTVLQGTLGLDFRKAYWNVAHATDVIVCAGFLGVEEAPPERDGDEQPLLRLPFIVGLLPLGSPSPAPNSFAQSNIPTSGIDIAWADSGAAHGLVARSRNAKSPAGPGEADLVAAIRAGALVQEDGTAPTGSILAAQLVEQTFRDPRSLGDPGQIGVAPFWLGAAVSVSKLFNTASGKDYRPMSVVAGSISVANSPTPMRRGTAAVIHGLPGRALKVTDERSLVSVLFSGEDKITQDDWTGPNPFNQGDPAASVSGYAFGLARSHHVRPLFAVVRTTQDGSARYTTANLPLPVSADLPISRPGSRVQTQFAEGARGYAVSPGPAAQRWLPPILEGRVAAVRDDDGSGIAGLGRSLALPTQASDEVTGLEASSARASLARKLIWFTEKRVPVYVPMNVKDMQAPPLSWLQGAPPRARLPADGDLALILFKAELGDESRNPKRMSAQAFLPDDASALTVSERAGIVTARRSLLLSAIDDPNAELAQFDPDFGRFGRPAQAGSSIRRWIRTPRPGPLPENKLQPYPPGSDQPEMDRRPDASPLLPHVPLRFVVGPADTVRGEATVIVDGSGVAASWSATFIACPGSDGIVSDRWDGSVRLRVELDVAYQSPSGAMPAPGKNPEPNDAASPEAPLPEDILTLLPKLLFPNDGNGAARSCGSLIIGGTAFILRWMMPANPQAWRALGEDGESTARPKPQLGAMLVWRGYLDLVFDPRTPISNSGTGSIHPGLAAAINSGFSAVELRLTVFPASTNAHPVVFVVSPRTPIKLAVPDPNVLTYGTDRPPVTLRWSLPAVSSNSGGMPLVPATMLFTDPSYESGLANPPSETSALIDTSHAADLPKSRGAASLFLWTDRARYNRSGSIAFMADIRFERSPPALATPGPDGDVVPSDGTCQPADGQIFGLSLQLFPASQTAAVRFLWVNPARTWPPVKLSTVYELSLGALLEDDGSPAQLAAGDALQLMIRDITGGAAKIKLWNSDTGVGSAPLALKIKGSELALATQLTLTDAPVVEPPPALYAALSHGNRDNKPSLSLPLYAQSPLPWRVDVRDLKQDFRAGLVRRSATFVWGLTRPAVEFANNPDPENLRAHIVKIDRNGQAYLPETLEEFVSAERPGQ